MLTVYVGGNLWGFEHHRQLVGQTILELGMTPILTFPTGVEIISSIEEAIHDADIYLSILGRYGIIPKVAPRGERNGEPKSYNEFEYILAGERGIPRLMYFPDEKHDKTPGIFPNDAQDGDKIYAFQREVMDQFSVSFFISPEDLQAKVRSDLMAQKARLEARRKPSAATAQINVSEDTTINNLNELIALVKRDDLRNQLEKELKDIVYKAEGTLAVKHYEEISELKRQSADQLTQQIQEAAQKKDVTFDAERQQLKKAIDDCKGETADAVNKAKTDLSAKMQSEHTRLLNEKIQEVEDKKDVIIKDLTSKIAALPNQIRQDTETQLNLAHQAELINRIKQAKDEKDVETISKIDTATLNLRRVIGLLVGVIGVGLIIAVPRLANMAWLDAHPNRDGLYLGGLFIVAGVVVAIVSRKYREWAIGAIVIATIVSIITILGRIESPTPK